MAISTPFAELVRRTVIELSQVSGLAVQSYSEDRIAQLLQQTFNLCFDKLWWPDYMEWRTYTLDGVSGLPIETITDVLRYEDFRRFYPGSSSKPLRELPKNINAPALSGTYPRYVSADNAPGKLFRVWPKLSGGTVNTHVRLKPADFIAVDTVKLDADLLVYGASMTYSTSDGVNPGESSLFGQKFTTRMKEMRALLQQPVELDSRDSGMQDQWQESP